MTRPRSPGVVVVVAGPDGSGKTAVTDALAARLERPVRRFHHRPQLLPAKTAHEGPVTEPHKNPEYPTLLSLLKVLYLYADYVLGWLFFVRPWVRSGGAVLMERGWWDLVVDPVRYRLKRSLPVLSALRVLGRLQPRASLTAVLHASPSVLLERKAELPEAELVRQMEAWRAQPARCVRGVFVDVAAPLDDIVDRLVHLVRRSDSDGRAPVRGQGGGPRVRSDEHRLVVSRHGRVRWNVPARPRRVARAVPQLQQPMTPGGQVLWRFGRAAAGLGALHLVPGTAPPPEDAIDPIRGSVPADSHLAVAHSNHAARYAVLVLSPTGEPQALAKVATDDVGRAQLRREAERQRFARALSAPLRAPRLLQANDDALLFEPILWRPRWQPWRLDVDVARALGSFYRAGAAGPEEPGYAHGDCAPWNLLRATEAWYLVDWEEATDRAAPYTDVFHYLVQAHALLGRPRSDDIISGLDGRGWVHEVLAAYSDGAGLAPSLARRYCITYLEDSSHAVDLSRADGVAGLRARRRLLEVL